MHSSPTRAVGIAAAVATVVIWTGFIVVARAMALRSLSPWDIVLCRIVGASLVLVPWGLWIVRRRRAAGGTAPSWLGVSPLGARLTIACGLFGGIGYAVFAYAGFVYAPAAHGSVLLPGMLPMWTALLSVAMLGERLAPARLVALAMILGGGALVGGGSLLHAFDGGDVWKGDLLFLAASACWSAYTVLVRRERLDPVEATIAITVFALLAYVPAYAALAWAGAIDSRIATAPFAEMAFQAFWQGVGSVVISGITFVTMVRAFGPVRSTMLTALVPGLSAMGAVLLLGEPLGVNLVAGLALVTAGILVGVRGVRAAPPAATAQTAAGPTDRQVPEAR
jgi:drug/metabolite transporter (DMT)-like permease